MGTGTVTSGLGLSGAGSSDRANHEPCQHPKLGPLAQSVALGTDVIEKAIYSLPIENPTRLRFLFDKTLLYCHA